MRYECKSNRSVFGQVGMVSPFALSQLTSSSSQQNLRWKCRLETDWRAGSWIRCESAAYRILSCGLGIILQAVARVRKRFVHSIQAIILSHASLWQLVLYWHPLTPNLRQRERGHLPFEVLSLQSACIEAQCNASVGDARAQESILQNPWSWASGQNSSNKPFYSNYLVFRAPVLMLSTSMNGCQVCQIPNSDCRPAARSCYVEVSGYPFSIFFPPRRPFLFSPLLCGSKRGSAILECSTRTNRPSGVFSFL